MAEQSTDMPEDVTLLLRQWTGGDNEAMEKVLPLIYSELRNTARRVFSFEKPDQTLQATALIGEVYMRFQKGGKVEFKNREHFFGVAGTMMRRILVDHARARTAQKRGFGVKNTFAEERSHFSTGQLDEDTLIALDSALNRLAEKRPRLARIVELSFFAGMNQNEIADALEISATTVQREWSEAKQWLFLELDRA